MDAVNVTACCACHSMLTVTQVRDGCCACHSIHLGMLWHAAGVSYDDASCDAHLPNLVSVRIPEEEYAPSSSSDQPRLCIHRLAQPNGSPYDTAIYLDFCLDCSVIR
jgi:hypothetical protein